MLEWQNTYAIGNEIIDKEHQKLFELTNIILRVQQTKNEEDTVKHVVRELFAYMKYHFEHEERWMEAIGYPGRSHHQMIHQEIINEMNEMLKRIKSLDELRDALREIMIKWVLQHILNEDTRISPAL